ncbi:MAG TPA: DUF3987 domain-containing protein [Thermomicrobiales bacterium]|nr:DUF3987 domain-containing protein [Thermomicrobiales bacterium]
MASVTGRNGHGDAAVLTAATGYPRAGVATWGTPESGYPAPPDPAAYHGLAGEIVAALAPHTEADPVALLATLLAAAGSIVGQGPHYLISGRRHTARVYPALVGPTSTGRKGTSWSALEAVLSAACPAWFKAVVPGGLTSGEGLIWHIRDPIVTRELVKVRGEVIPRDVESDPGVADKRLFVVEEEFAAVLRVLAREANTLSAVIRRAWDGGTLRTLTKHHSATASDAHVSILGHVTPDELRRRLDDTEAANGFANRFLWLCVKRARVLPDGDTSPDEGAILGLAAILEATLEEARGLGRLTLDDEARADWHTVYEALTTDAEGFVGALLARGAPQVLRLALVYALLDVAPRIRRPHLEAALALWGYAAASVRHLFGDASGDPIADTILAALASGPMTQTEIHDLYSQNVRADRLAAALGRLVAAGLVRVVDEPAPSGRGRRAKVWSLA